MRGTIGPCSQGRSAWRQMWWCASTMRHQRLPLARAAKRRRACPRGAFSTAGSACSNRSSAGRSLPSARRVEHRQDCGHGARLRPVARIGGKRRHPDQPVAEPRQARDGVHHGVGLAALEPVGKHQRDRAAHQRCIARHRQEGFQRGADAGAAVEVEDQVGEPGQRLVRLPVLQCAGDPRQPRAEAEGLDLGAGARDQSARSAASPPNAPSSSRRRRPAAAAGAACRGAPCETAAASRRRCAAPRARCARRRCGGRAGRADRCGSRSSAAGRCCA